MGLAVLFALALGIGAILGWVAIFRVSRLATAIKLLELRLARQEQRTIRPADTRPREASEPPTHRPTAPAAPESPALSDEPRAPLPARPTRPVETERWADAAPTAASAAPGLESAAHASLFIDRLVANIRQNWMTWLGGVSVALAGIFLVGYSIEMGLLGPRARIAAGLLTGIALHVVAEWLRRGTGNAHPAFAALAGGASITLYAAVYAALELYSLIGPGPAFALLAIISLATMALALLHGPMLAIIGVLGAYAVPALVSTDTGNILIALIYSLIITAAALYLIRYVYRPWLWYGMLAGALGWWLLSLTSMDADGYRGLYLGAFAYLALAVPVLDWTLRRAPQPNDPGTEPIRLGELPSFGAIELTIVLIALAEGLSIVHLNGPIRSSPFEIGPALIEWSPLVAVVLLATRQREALRLAPWILLVSAWFAWLLAALDTGLGVRVPENGSAFLAFAAAMALLFSLGSWLGARGKPFDHLRSSLICLAPVLWLALAYLLVTDLSADWVWSLATLGMGLVYVFIARARLSREPNNAAAIWLILGGHLAYSLAVAMFFREATLTLALAAQLISLAWLNRRFGLAALPWIVKCVLALIVARLTLNPWLLTYPSDVHWSLWTYGGAALCCLIASRMTASEIELRKWLEAATLHLVVLFLGAEVRYWLYDGRIFIDELTLKEAAIDTALWGGLALSYFRRGQASRQLAQFYTLCSRVLMVLALGGYALALTPLNPLWGSEPVAATWLWNILLLAYGAPVLIAVLAYRFYEPQFKNIAACIAGGGLLVFVSLEIRHFWQRALALDLGTSDAESYTYSVAWMVMAVVTILAATRLGSKGGYKAGMGLLLVVIAKIFLIDMGDLEGLLRVASFMGLGLALLGLAYLYRTVRPVS